MSEEMKPGATALAVIDLPANSLANVLVSPITPACVNAQLLSWSPNFLTAYITGQAQLLE